MGSKHKQAAGRPDESGATLFVCVRQRNGEGASCAGRGSRALIEKMRAMLAAEAIPAVELTVRPCGCLGLCKQGPAAAVATGEARLAKKPPKARKGRRGVYTRVEGEDVRDMLRETLLQGAAPER